MGGPGGLVLFVYFTDPPTPILQAWLWGGGARKYGTFAIKPHLKSRTAVKGLPYFRMTVVTPISFAKPQAPNLQHRKCSPSSEQRSIESESEPLNPESACIHGTLIQNKAISSLRPLNPKPYTPKPEFSTKVKAA